MRSEMLSEEKLRATHGCPCSSDEWLDVGLALVHAALVDGSPVVVLDGGDEGEDAGEPETAEAHPEGVEVPAEDPGG